MAHILAVGNATLDIINIVDAFPLEDSEVRALSQEHRRGGNATNTLVVLSLLGHDCSWAGALADEPDARLILDDLRRHNIDTRAVQRSARGKVPTSYITLNNQNGSRTIIHYRDLAEYGFSTFPRIDFSRFDWIHFEGRNVSETRKMLEYLRLNYPAIPVSLEIEKIREGIEGLFEFVSVVLFSKAYAQGMGFSHAESFLNGIAKQAGAITLICSWGEKGAFALTPEGKFITSPAFPPLRLVDTIGAGDTFNAGIIDSLVKGKTVDVALIEAARLAGKKCGCYGFDELAD
jgi:ketohexokinase